jgi:hypothetical protein
MVAHSQRIRDRGQRGVHGTNAAKETRVYDIEIIEFMRFAVHIQN